MAAGTAFNEQQFESKLVNLKDSQESINALSSWCLQNKDHHKKIVNCWLHCLKRVKIEQRLSLFYLANDVIQYSKRKHYQFVESWGTALQKATTLVRDEKVKGRIMRIFKIWDERGVYDEAFISDLCGLLATNIKKKSEINIDSSEFQASALVNKISECKKLEDDTDLRFRKVKDNHLPLTDANSMRNSLKDRRQGSDIFAEVDQGVKKMEAYVKALEMEIMEREKLTDMLHQGTLFYETQRGEAKIVCNAYRNFGNKVKGLKRKLDELIPTLVESPIPSPDVNAPSPSPDSDLELPTDPHSEQHPQNPQNPQSNPHHPQDNGLDFSFTSFMGNSEFLSDINLGRDILSERSEPRHVNSNNNISLSNSSSSNTNSNSVRPIEVISTRSERSERSEHKGSDAFSITDFIKSLLPGGVPKPEDAPEPPAPPLKPPPMPPVFDPGSWPPAAPWRGEGEEEGWDEAWPLPALDTPESPPLYEKEGASAPVEYDDSIPVPPVPDVDHRTLLVVPPAAPQDMDHREHHPRTLPVDIDHRNLISLTGSPKEGKPLVQQPMQPLQPPPQFVWPGDQDYRAKPSDVDFRVPPPKIEERKDNVESIDMDVSEEDEEENGLIQLNDDIDDRLLNSMESNLTNFSMSSSFIDNLDLGGSLPVSHDVDERLKSLFSGMGQSAGAIIVPPEERSLSPVEEEGDSDKERGGSEDERNGFAEDHLDERLEERPEPLMELDGRFAGGWKHGMMDHPPPFRGAPPFRGGEFRMRWNSPRPMRSRGPMPRFPFMPPGQGSMRGRMPFRNMRPRLQSRGRW